MAGSSRDVWGLRKSTEAEHRMFDPALEAGRITEIPSNLQMRVEYTDGNATYMGFADKGMGISASGWLLHKNTFDASGNVTLRQISYDAWDDRSLATYE